MIQSAARRSKQSRGRRNKSEAVDIIRTSSPYPVALDPHDPNYDSEDSQDEKVTLVSSMDPKPFAMSYPENSGGFPGAKVMMLADYKTAVTSLIHEFFVCEDVDDFSASIADLGSPSLHYELVRRVVTIAMERNARECELASRSLLYMREAKVLSEESLKKGFERLFELADDLELDFPRAKEYLARFVARAVADECIPPSFLMDKFIVSLGGEVVQSARQLLSIRHGASRLSRIWGPAAIVHKDDDDEGYVSALKNEVKMLLGEYLMSGDIDEAVVCVKRLEAPHYHHELVKRAVSLALDGKQRQRAMMSTLIYELHVRGVLSSVQVALGFRRLANEVDDLELDTPGAAKILDIFFEQAVRDGVVTRNDLPSLS